MFLKRLKNFGCEILAAKFMNDAYNMWVQIPIEKSNKYIIPDKN